jgi:hypothetical protein
LESSARPDYLVDILLWQFKVFQQSYSDFNFPEHPVAYNTSADNAMQ